MKKYALAIALLIPVYVALVVCCTPTLHPIYTDEDIVFYPELLGVWVGDEDTDIQLEFTQYEENVYRLVLTDEENLTGNFIVHLVSIGDLLYMDLYPEGPDLDTSNIYYFHLVPIHSFTRIDSIDPQLSISMIDGDWLDEFMEENPDVLSYEMLQDDWSGERLLFTANTGDIQDWLIEYAENEEMYGEPLVFTRITEDENATGEEETADDDETIEKE